MIKVVIEQEEIIPLKEITDAFYIGVKQSLLSDPLGGDLLQRKPTGMKQSLLSDP